VREGNVSLKEDGKGGVGGVIGKRGSFFHLVGYVAVSGRGGSPEKESRA